MRTSFHKKYLKGTVSLLLIFSIMASLFVPFPVYAAEEPATGNEIGAVVYKIANNQYEVVLQRGFETDPNKEAVAVYGKAGTDTEGFADKDLDGTAQWNLYLNCPWLAYKNYITTLTIKDKIAPRNMRNFCVECKKLTTINNIDNIDTSQCVNFESAFKTCNALTSIDISSFDFSSATMVKWMFQNTPLESIKLPSTSIGSNPSEYTGKVNIDRFFSNTNLEEIEIDGLTVDSRDFDLTHGSYSPFRSCKKLKRVTIKNIDFSVLENMNFQTMFADCTALESVTFENIKIESQNGYLDFRNLFLDNTGIKSVTFRNVELSAKTRVYLSTFFKNCTNLENVEFDSFKVNIEGDYAYFESLFEGCESLTSVDLSSVEISTPSGRSRFNSLFSGCTSLETVNLDGFKADRPSTFFNMFGNCSSLISVDFSKAEINSNTNIILGKMFAGCSTLESVDFTNLKIPFNVGDTIADNTFAGCTFLRELKIPDCTSYNNKGYNIFVDTENLSYIEINTNWKHTQSLPEIGTWTKVGDIANPPSNAVMLGTKKSNTDLFQRFDKSYAGNWLAESTITLRGNGGSPKFQTVNGTKGGVVDFNPDDYTAEREGYDFAGWFPTKDVQDGEQKLRTGDTAEQWSYYAHWNPHRYKLILNGGDGGTTVKDGSTVTEFIADDNLAFNQFFELSNTMFTKDGYILSSWNTRANGDGTRYSANDSVTQLTVMDGGVVTLFAQWHKPDVVISFDPNYENAPSVNNREYTLVAGETTLYGDLAEIERSGFTFMGWYTEAEGGDKVTSDSEVTESRTLYAHWMVNPRITFNANGGTFDGRESIIKVYKYDYTLGVLPTPEYGAQTFEGWFTAASGGTMVTSNTKATGDAEYYAHWGYQPKFETNGGKFTEYPDEGYPIQQSASYIITELPEVEKAKSTFVGWYHGDTKVENGDTLDLSGGNVISARWIDSDVYTVALNANGGIVSPNSINVYSGSKLGELTAPSRDGYDFEGWYDNEQFTGGAYSAESVIDSDKTLYAKWTERDCTLTFDPDGGLMYDDAVIKVASGKTVPALPGVNRVGFAFNGWYTEQGGQGEKLNADTVITENKKYYAYWTPVDITTDIYQYSINWSTDSNSNVTNTGDTLVFHPLLGNDISAILYVRLKIDSFQAPDKTIDIGKVKITIPKSFFTENGVALDSNNINGFASDTYSYDTVGDNYVFTNKVKLNANNNSEVTLACKVSPRAIKGGYVDENGYYQGDYFKNTITPSIVIDDAQNPLNYSRELSLEAHTKVDTKVSKARANVILEWDPSWGSTPADASEYFYVIWNLNSSVLTSSSQKCTLSWDEDTVHDGTLVYAYPSLTADSGEIESGNFNTVIVTKHTKKGVEGDITTIYNEAILNADWASGHKEQFRVSAFTKAYIPAGSDGIFNFTKTVPNPYNSGAHFKNSGQELILSGENVILPYEINYTESENGFSPVWNSVTQKYTAGRRDMVITDGEKGDSVISSLVTADSYNWGDSTEKALNDSDYCFNALTIELKEFDAVYMNGIWSNPFEHSAYSDYDDVQIYIRTEGSDSFTLFKTIRDFSETMVDLPENTVGFKLKHSSEFYTTSIKVTADLCLRASSRIVSLVRDDVSRDYNTIIKNKAKIDVTAEVEGVEQHRIVDTSAQNGWLSAYELNIGTSYLYAAKDCSDLEDSIEPNSAKATETIPVVISGWGYNASNNLKLMKSGEFYDLLPFEFSVDKDSVFILPRTSSTTKRNTDADEYNNKVNDANKFSSGYYSVDFTENWQNTGRTLMTVKFTVPDGVKATGVDVYYKMTTSYVNIITNGQHQTNIVAFTDTTEGQSMPSIRDGSLSIIDKKYRDPFGTVDSDFTAFNMANTNCSLPVMYEHGARSVVKTDGVYKTSNETVGLNTDYSYYIVYAGDSLAHTKDLVIYDIIEQRLDGTNSEWTGNFNGVDIAGLSSVESSDPADGRCAPVVYYSTRPKADFLAAGTDALDVDNSEFWTTVMPDKSLVTAVAVDCRKTNLDKDFILPPKKQINIHVDLTSPSSAPRNDMMTYNESYIKAHTLETGDNNTELTRTSVMLHFAELDFHKSSFPETGTNDNPETVVKNSVIDYKLTVGNTDDTVSVRNIVVEDTLPANLSINNSVTVGMSENEAIAIGQTKRISSYSITEQGGRVKFTAVITSLAPGETITIKIPATVNADNNTTIINTAYIQGFNDIAFEPEDYIESETTYHIVANIQAKILKVNSKGEPLKDATLQILDSENNVINEFTSSESVFTCDITPGNYTLHEVSPPSATYKLADDIPFTIDVEGFAHVGGETVSRVVMVDQPAYKIIFHENMPGGTDEEKQKVFRIYEPSDLRENKVTHFYDIPEWAGDEYVFAGWYHNDGYDYLENITNDNTTAEIASNFENETFTAAARSGADSDYHIYAKWIKVGTVAQDEKDTNIYNGEYRGFGLAGIQIREPKMYDSNYEKITPGGLRFVTSLSESLLSSIDALSTQTINTAEGNVNVEYGYAVGTEENIKAFTTNYGISDPVKYQLQYKGMNVNGVNTTGEERTANTDFRFITNVNCTRGTTNTKGTITDDHRNFTNYRLFTLVVTYEGDDAVNKDKKLAARAYIRYYDANGKLRVFYNTYKKSMYGGCMCSYNQAQTLAIPRSAEGTENSGN